MVFALKPKILELGPQNGRRYACSSRSERLSLAER